jgi:hypothetical protein
MLAYMACATSRKRLILLGFGEASLLPLGSTTRLRQGFVWFWPKIAAGITAKHPGLVIACDSCGTDVDLDVRVKPRDAEASIRVALRDVRSPRCNGHRRPRIVALASHPSI